jgi:hypothetical protein
MLLRTLKGHTNVIKQYRGVFEVEQEKKVQIVHRNMT